MLEKIWGFLKYVIKYRINILDQIIFYTSLAGAIAIILNVGYITNPLLDYWMDYGIHSLFYLLFVLTFFRTAASIFMMRRLHVEHYSGIFVLGYYFIVIFARISGLPSFSFFTMDQWIYLGIFLLFMAVFSKTSLFFDNFYFNPTILFVISFLLLILLGTILLMLPRSTVVAPLSFIDAVFMSTSSVCITGLSVTDISQNYSLFGQTVTLILIQIGGLGIMTFTGFFGYFFSGGFSFKNQLMFGEILGENKVASVISTLLKIIFITLFFESIGAVWVFFTLDPENFESTGSQIFFAVFHSVSSFCNAGFSILSGGISNASYQFNYPFQLALSFLFILGGLGFGIVFNFYTSIRNGFRRIYKQYILKQPYKYRTRMFSFNSKFILICNAIMLVLATLMFYFLERPQSLQVEQSAYGKWITSFFMANASRSAGYNSINLQILQTPTIILITLLMWIGMSPGSTGGGVKVTTIAVSVLNIFSLAKGKQNIELFRRRIAEESIQKAFAIILLSIGTIGISFILLNFSDPDKELKALLFECVSAYSTCGLSLGITPNLSVAGKIVIVFTMFVGRVGMLTLLVAFIKNIQQKRIIYPSEKIQF